MPYTHDEQKYEPDPPKKKFDPLFWILLAAILTLTYLIIRYHDILFPTLLLPS